MFSKLAPILPSPFDTLEKEFEADPNPEKILLATGVVLDEAGEVLCLECVKKAEKHLLEHPYTKSYPPTSGIPEFIQAARSLLYIENCASVAASSCGALSLVFHLLKRCGVRAVCTPAPTWGMYAVFAEAAGLELRAISEPACCIASYLGPTDALLVQAGCSNPSGMDLSRDQFSELARILGEKSRICVLDIAYQGVSRDILQDRDFAPLFSLQTLLCAQFFDKNFTIYAEGASVVHAVDSRMQGYLEALVSGLFGIAPVHGQHVVATVYQHYFAEYQQEYAAIRQRIAEIRAWIARELDARGVRNNVAYQNGIYAFLDLTTEQLSRLKRLGVYLVDGGRVNLCSVNAANIGKLCDGVAKVFQ